MVEIITPLTFEDAINEILSTIGQSPVSALEEELNLDALQAIRKLKLAVRSIQADGWTFNKEFDFPLYRNSNDEIIIPPNVYSLDVCTENFDQIDPVIRGGKLYDRYNHTYKFSKDLKAEVIFILPFEDLPESAKDYAFLMAARRFQASLVASRIRHAFTSEDENGARLKFLRDHQNIRDYNLFGGRDRYRPRDLIRNAPYI